MLCRGPYSYKRSANEKRLKATFPVFVGMSEWAAAGWWIFAEGVAGFHNYVLPVVRLGCALCNVSVSKGKSLNTGGKQSPNATYILCQADGQVQGLKWRRKGLDLPCALSLAPTRVVVMNKLYPRGWASLIFIRDLWQWMQEGVITSVL